MNAVEKFKNIINDEEFVAYLSREFRFTDVMAKSITKILESKKTSYFPDVFRSLMTLLINTNLSEEEKTEVIAYYINKCMIIFEEDTKENRNIYMTKTAFSSEKKYDMLHANLKRIRTIISSDGEILPCNCKWDINEIASIQMYVPLPKQYIRDILVLSNYRYKKQKKQEMFLKKIAQEMANLINDITECKRIITPEEIEKAKQIMSQLNYTEEQTETVLHSIEKSNAIVVQKNSMLKEENKTKKPNVDYKVQKKLLFELSQYIDLDKNMPYDYLNESEITEISNLMNLLGYSIERMHTILTNIKKKNDKEQQIESETEIILFRQDIFAEIDECEDKPFETPASDIYFNALNNETMLEDKNEKINKAISDIDEAIKNIIICTSDEDRNIWVSYIIELLYDIDLIFNQAIEWNLVRTRKGVK